jgi:hypothetical protein
MTPTGVSRSADNAIGTVYLDTMATIEHLKRKTDGGTDVADNLALSCNLCNSERGSVDWLAYTSYRRGEIKEPFGLHKKRMCEVKSPK